MLPMEFSPSEVLKGKAKTVHITATELNSGWLVEMYTETSKGERVWYRQIDIRKGVFIEGLSLMIISIIQTGSKVLLVINNFDCQLIADCINEFNTGSI